MKKALIVVDYQKEFTDGANGFKQAIELDERICNRITKCRKNGFDIIFTLDTHFENYLEDKEADESVLHAVREKRGWELYGKTGMLKTDKDMVVSKYSPGSADLLELLKNGQYDAVELVGVVTEVCVLANAVIAQTALPEAEIVIWRDCVASADCAMQSKALDVMRNMGMTIE